MLKLVARRLLSVIPLLLLVSILVFLLLELVPGDAARTVAGENATEEEIEETRERLGLNDPLPVRYVRWLGNAVTGDLGTSLYSSESVVSLIWQRVPITLSLAVVSFVIALGFGLTFGLLAGVKPNTWVDRTVSSISALSMALPPFVVGLFLVLFFAVERSWFPATGYAPVADGVGEWLRHLILPAIALATIPAAELARQTRGALVDTMGRDFIRTARAKGLRRRRVIGKHALKNAGIPIVTVIGLQAARVLSGAVTVEFIFAIPGFGSLAVSAVNLRDLPLIQGIVLTSAIAVIAVNLVVDILYGYFNPRLRQ